MKKKVVLFFIACIYFSLNARAQWVPTWSGGGTLSSVSCFIESAGSLIAGTSTGTITSIDNGSTWTKSDSGMVYFNSRINCLGKNSAGIFAGAFNKIYFSNDNGAFWSVVLSDSGEIFRNMAFISDTVFVATYHQGVIMSPDIGQTWMQVNNGISTNFVYEIIEKNNLLYAGTRDSGLFVSSNSGISWSPSNSGLPIPITVYSLDTDGLGIYAGTNSGVYKSLDNGTTWMPSSNGLPPYWEMKIVCLGGTLLASNYHVYRSLDQGASWSYFSDGIDTTCCGGADGGIVAFYLGSDYVLCGDIIGCPVGIYRIGKDEVLSINENLKSNTSFYLMPNPSTDMVMLEVPHEFGVVKKIEIYSSLGQLHKAKYNDLSLDISNLCPGLYFVVITNLRGEKLVEELIKE